MTELTDLAQIQVAQRLTDPMQGYGLAAHLDIPMHKFEKFMHAPHRSMATSAVQLLTHVVNKQVDKPEDERAKEAMKIVRKAVTDMKLKQIEKEVLTNKDGTPKQELNSVLIYELGEWFTDETTLKEFGTRVDLRMKVIKKFFENKTLVAAFENALEEWRETQDTDAKAHMTLKGALTKMKEHSIVHDVLENQN